jgi:hypothetical protein
MSSSIAAYFPENVLERGIPGGPPMNRTQRKRAQREARKAARKAPHLSPAAPDSSSPGGEEQEPAGAQRGCSVPPLPDGHRHAQAERSSRRVHSAGVEGEVRSAPSKNALKHGLFTQDLVQTEAPLHEDAARFDAFLADLRARYRPEGEEESAIVDSIAAAWWRRQRLARYMSRTLTERARGGRLLLVCIEESEKFAPHEARLERSLTRQRRDLALLQQYRLGRKPQWKLADAADAAPPAQGTEPVTPETSVTPAAAPEAKANPESASYHEGVPLLRERERHAQRGEGEVQLAEAGGEGEVPLPGSGDGEARFVSPGPADGFGDATESSAGSEH